MSEFLTLYNNNNLKDKDDDIPPILSTTKTVIESEKFRKYLGSIHPLINRLGYNDFLKIENKNGGKHTKHNFKKKGKTKKNKIYKGGDKSVNGLKYIIMSIIIVAIFSTSSNSVYELFTSFIQYPKSFFDNIIVPFSTVFLNNINMPTTVTSSIGYNVLNSSVSNILIPTIGGFYNTCITSLTGNVLAINGLWALYLNSTKLFDYITSLNTNITDPRIQPALNEVNKSLNDVVKEIAQPQQLNLTNIVDENNKTIDIPEGSKLLIPEGSHI